RLNGTGVRRAAIERPDGPVVDALLEAGFEVVVVASRSVKALRVRYGSAGNKSDRTDAYVLADCLRTDGHRWASLQPDSPATATLRSHVRARKDLVEHRVAVANQLRAHLKVVFPGPVGLFSDLDSPTSLAFLRRFPSAGKAAWLSREASRCLAPHSKLWRPPPSRRPLPPPRPGTSRAAGRRRRRAHPRHLGVRDAPRNPPHPDQSPQPANRRTVGRPPRRPHLPIPSQGR